MNHRSLFFAICLIFVLGISACTAVPQPTPSPAAAAEIVTVAPKRPSATSTAQFPTHTPTQTIAKPTNIPTVAISPTMTPIPTLHQSLPIDFEMVMLPINNGISWSPTANELLYNTCPDDLSPLSDTYLYIASSPDFVPNDVTPQNITCRSTSNFLWHLNGQKIVFEGLPFPQDILFETDIWIMDLSDLQVRNFDRIGKFIRFIGWMDENTLVYEDYWGGGGTRAYHLLDINENEEIAYAILHAGNARILNSQFLIGQSGDDYAFNYSAVIISKNILYPDSPLGSPYLHFLSFNNEGYREVFYNSRIQNWSSEQLKVLVLTWDKEVNLHFVDLSQDVTKTNLQLWDIQENTLTLVAPKSVYGHLSDNGDYLLLITSVDKKLHIQLMEISTKEILFSNDLYTEGGETIIYAYTSFSPNGRFLTYYSPEQNLVIYDIAFGEFLPSVTAGPMTPIWSPDNGRFVYQDPELGLSLYEVETKRTYALTQDGCDELRNPQWSFDGSYLSVDVPCAGTAVLQLP